MKELLKNKKFIFFVAKFLFVFCVLYFGTLAVIGLSSPGKYYSPFIAGYLDYVSAIKRSLVVSAQFFASLFGVETFAKPGFILRLKNGQGFLVAMSCVGYGVYSFWTAYVVANNGKTLKKIYWIVGGLLLLWLINVMRITLVIVAIYNGWPMPFGIDHHTLFNIFAYIAIFIMMWRFEKSQKKILQANNENRSLSI